MLAGGHIPLRQRVEGGECALVMTLTDKVALEL